IAANETVDLQELLVSEAEIGFAHGYQRIAILARGPDPERIVGVIRRALPGTALGVHQHGIDDERVALPFPPRTLWPAGKIGRIATFKHDAFDRVGIASGPGVGRVHSRCGEIIPVLERYHRREPNTRLMQACDERFEARASFDEGTFAQI